MYDSLVRMAQVTGKIVINLKKNFFYMKYVVTLNIYNGRRRSIMVPMIQNGPIRFKCNSK